MVGFIFCHYLRLNEFWSYRIVHSFRWISLYFGMIDEPKELRIIPSPFNSHGNSKFSAKKIKKLLHSMIKFARDCRFSIADKEGYAPILISFTAWQYPPSHLSFPGSDLDSET